MARLSQMHLPAIMPPTLRLLHPPRRRSQLMPESPPDGNAASTSPSVTSSSANEATVRALLKGTTYGKNGPFGTCLTNLVDDIVVGMSAGDNGASLEKQAGGFNSARYLRASGVMQDIGEAQHLTPALATGTEPVAIRQWLLDLPSGDVYSPCAVAAGLPPD